MKRLLLLALLFLLLPCVVHAGTTTIVTDPEPGTNPAPYNCGCNDTTPIPDQGTLNTINNFINAMGPWTGYPPHPQSPGDQIIVCNSGGCATYTMTSNGTWAQGSYAKGTNNGGGPPICQVRRAVIEKTTNKLSVAVPASKKDGAAGSSKKEPANNGTSAN